MNKTLEFKSEAKYDIWYKDIISDFLQNKGIKLEHPPSLAFGYYEFGEDKPPSFHIWDEALILNQGEQDLQRIILLPTKPPDIKIIRELLIRCQNNAWAHTHKDWNDCGEGYTVPYDAPLPAPWACTHHYGDYQLMDNAIIITWAPCYCS